MDQLLNDFAAHLTVEGYAQSTVRTFLREVRLAIALVQKGEPLPTRIALRAAVGHLVRFAEAQPAVPGPVVAALNAWHAASKPQRGKRAGPRKRRKKVAKSVDDAAWARLCSAIEADPAPESRILEVICATGARIGDVLGVSRERMALAARTGVIDYEAKGGVERRLLFSEPWQRLWSIWPRDAPCVAAILCPGNVSPLSGDCAYQRVHRALRRFAAELGIPGLHLHRLRRTLIVQALRETRDLEAVRQLVGHKNLATTQGYADEARPEDVAVLQQQLRERFREAHTDEDSGEEP